MSKFDYINRTYGLQLKRGTRVEYTGGKFPRQGSVVSTDGQYINIRFDNSTSIDGPYHPTWEMRALEPEAAT